MKKLFSFVFCAFCALSVWGTNPIQIGSGSSSDANSPISMGPAIYNSITQQLYLAEELDGAPSKTITAIGFYYTSTTEYTRTLEIYLSKTSKIQLSSSSGADQWMYYESESDHSAGTLVFSGSYTLPNQAGWYSIELSTPFEWDGTSNIVVTVNDKSNAVTGNLKKHRCYTATKNRTIYKSSPTSGTSFDGLDTYSIKGTATTSVPQIQFTFKEEGPTPVTTPTITTSTDALNFGTCYPEYEDAIKTFTVKASDLSDKITITAPTGVVVSPTEIAKEEAALAGDGVTITAQITKDFTFPAQVPSITIASEDATSKTVKVNATEGTFTTLSMMSFLNTEGYFFLNFDATINSINTSDKSMEIRNVSPKNANYALIDGQETFAVGGKFSGLKGKYENEVFKIFSYTNYTAPAPTSVVEIDEDVDHSADWSNINDGDNVTMLTIKRAIVPNQWNSIVLPTHLTSTEVENIFGTNTDLEEFTSAVVTSSSVTLNFTQLGQGDGLEAGTPYLIKPTKEVENPLNLQNHSFTKTVTPVDYDGISFEGVLVPTVIDGGDGSDYIIVGANNTLLHPTGTGTIKGMRAYFHVVGTEAKAALRTAKISMNTGSTTEMVLIKDNQTKPYKTMVNDQIVIVNEGKQINILGQIVK